MAGPGPSKTGKRSTCNNTDVDPENDKNNSEQKLYNQDPNPDPLMHSSTPTMSNTARQRAELDQRAPVITRANPIPTGSLTVEKLLQNERNYTAWSKMVEHFLVACSGLNLYLNRTISNPRNNQPITQLNWLINNRADSLGYSFSAGGQVKTRYLCFSFAGQARVHLG
jgi:hypothetical protein